jgi:hypothetical protein
VPKKKAKEMNILPHNNKLVVAEGWVLVGQVDAPDVCLDARDGLVV